MNVRDDANFARKFTQGIGWPRKDGFLICAAHFVEVAPRQRVICSLMPADEKFLLHNQDTAEVGRLASKFP